MAYVECICKCVRNIISHNKQLVDAKLKVVPCSDSSATENAVVVQLSDVLLSKLEEFVERVSSNKWRVLMCTREQPSSVH